MGFEFQVFQIAGATWLRAFDPSARRVVGYWSRRDDDAPDSTQAAIELEQKIDKQGRNAPAFVAGWDYWVWFVPEQISGLVSSGVLDQSAEKASIVERGRA